MDVRPTLFISYRRTQTATVRPVVVALERCGIDCFFDQADIDPLADFPERVRQGIDACHATLVWWSVDYGDSDHCLAELRRAWQHARRHSSDVGRRIWVLNPEKEGEELSEALLPRIDSARDIRTHAAIGDDIVHARHVATGLESASGVMLGLCVGGFESARGRYTAARQAEAAVLEMARRVQGEEHPATAEAAFGLLLIAHGQGDTDRLRTLIEASPPNLAKRLEAWRSEHSEAADTVPHPAPRQH